MSIQTAKHNAKEQGVGWILFHGEIRTNMREITKFCDYIKANEMKELVYHVSPRPYTGRENGRRKVEVSSYVAIERKMES